MFQNTQPKAICHSAGLEALSNVADDDDEHLKSNPQPVWTYRTDCCSLCLKHAYTRRMSNVAVMVMLAFLHAELCGSADRASI